MRRQSSIFVILIVIVTLFLQVFPAGAQSDFPSRFDLRDENLVSCVKNQWPWGSCWAFGATAAAEIGILSQLREISPDHAEYYADPDKLDLSELQQSWFAYTKLPEYDTYDPHSQAGEGVFMPNMYRLGSGGYTYMLGNSFAIGIGPIPESLAPYKVWDGDLDDEVNFSLNAVELSDAEEIWFVPEYLRFASAFELLESRNLPVFWTGDDDENYEFHPEAIDAVKAELMEKRGVAVSYCADTTRGNDESEGYEFLNRETYAHYIPEFMGANHVVCIVGWDDNYSRENFNPLYQPPADGAWIAKNSWGARTDPDDADSGWGVDGSGYFYLSYYDQSVATPTSFVFDVFSDDFVEEYLFKVIDQYDLFNGGTWKESAEDLGIEQMGVANVFTAHYDQYLRAVSLSTADPDQSVLFSIFKLNPGWESPEDGEELYTDLLSFPYEGWHKIDLDELFFISAGEDYSLVMYTDSYDIEQMLVSLDDPEDPDASDAVDSVVVVNEKDSFFMFNDQNEWMDWSDLPGFMVENKYGYDTGFVTFYDNPGLKAYAEPAVNLNASLEGYISDQGWVEGSEMYFRVIIGNPAGADFGPLIFRSALSGPADAMLIDEVPEGGTAEVNYIYYLTEEDVAAGTVTEYVTIQPAEASRLVGSVLRLSVFD